MDPFVRRLVQRLHHPSHPLSRNRHFHTFSTPEGRRALQTSRRLRSLQRDILACVGEGRGGISIHPVGAEGQRQIELALVGLKGRRVSVLEEDEFNLLRELPGMEAAFELANP
jgi:hypothetical protein